MRRQASALMVVYQALNETPRGFGGSASTTPRALMIACRWAEAVRLPAMMVLESLAAGDDRPTVEDKVGDLRKAMVRAEALCEAS